MKFKHLILVLLCSAFLSLQGQDFHNSFHQFAPMLISPSMTGAFYGNVRASVIGRDQGRAVAGAGNEWQDISLTADYNLDWSLTEGDWVAIGMNIVRSSSAGIGDHRRQSMAINAAYHLAFGKKLDKVFTLGVKYGPYSKLFNNGTAVGYEDPQSLIEAGSSSDLRTWLNTQFGQIDPLKKSKTDYAVGLMLDLPLGKTTDVRFGISADHLLAPNLNVQADSSNTGGVMRSFETLDRRLSGFAFLYANINPRLMFNPTLVVQKKGVSTSILTQFLFSYLYNQQKGISLIAGLGARFANSMDIPIYLAVDLPALRIGLSYDTNVSGLSPSTGTFGAVELAITKIFNWNKKANVDPVFICPRL